MDWLQYSCKYNVHIIDFFLFSFFNKGCYKSCLKKSRMRFQWILLVPLHCAHSLAPSIDAGQILAFNSWPSVHPMSKSWNDIGCTKGQLLKRRIWPASKHQGDWQMQWNELIKRALSTKTILRYGIFQRYFFLWSRAGAVILVQNDDIRTKTIPSCEVRTCPCQVG